MPTKRPRITVTETDTIAEALDLAADRWPDDREQRQKLLLHLVDLAVEAMRQDDVLTVLGRETAVARTDGVLTGAYEPGYLETLRGEWPE